MEIDPRSVSLSANKMSNSVQQNEHLYTSTPLANRSMAQHGDGFERHVQPKMATLFPSYETLWKEFIWDLTDRDISGGQGKVRHSASINLRRFASAHYTFLRSLLFTEGLLRTCNLGQSHPLEPYFVNERPLNYYAHMGRIRDMICLMAEEFETVRTGKKPGLRKNDFIWDYKKVGQLLASFESKAGTGFDAWQIEVSRYRDFIHKTAHVVAINSRGQWTILKPELVNKVRDWTEVNLLSPNDFVDLQAQLEKHHNDLLVFSSLIWNHYLTEVRSWKNDDGAYRNRLGLPC